MKVRKTKKVEWRQPRLAIAINLLVAAHAKAEPPGNESSRCVFCIPLLSESRGGILLSLNWFTQEPESGLTLAWRHGVARDKRLRIREHLHAK